MAGRLPDPFLSWANSAGVPYAGGSLTFYETGTSTPLDTYNDPDLAAPHANSNPLTLNSAGRPDTAIYLLNQAYKVVLKDSSGNEIWTADPVTGTDFASVIITKTGSGSPNGVVAGTAGSPGVLATAYWDYTNAIEYRCTTTGDAATAVWTAINAQAATATVNPPQGYLTSLPAGSGGPILTANVLAATAIYYTPFTGNLVPIYNGSRMIPTEFTELTLTLASQHALSTIYDVFVFSNSGVLTLVTGPAWSVSTAGSGARGTGAGTTEITRLKGYWVNAVSMTGRNGSTTYSIGANLATYLGSIFIDGTAGQVTCHRAWGQSRKWGIWNAYNRQPLYLKAGDATASWPYNSASIRVSNNAAANALSVFCGLAEEFFDLQFNQRVFIQTAQPDTALASPGIGWNSTSAKSGFIGAIGTSLNGGDQSVTIDGNGCAEFLQVPALGVNVVSALESTPDTGATITWYGGEDEMVLSAKWRG